MFVAMWKIEVHKLAVILSSMGIEYFHHRMVLLLVSIELRLKELFKNSLYSKGTEEFSFSTHRLASTLWTELWYYRFLTVIFLKLRSP